MTTKLVVAVTIMLGATIAPMVSAPAAPPRAAALPLSFLADIALPGNATRFDYQWVDAAQRRLYIAHLGDSSLLVFDLDGQRVLHEVPHLPSVHGVVAAPAQHLVLATATAEKTLALIDDTTFQVKARVAAGEYPNGLAFDPASERVFVSNNTGRGVAVVDTKSARSLPGIDIGGGAGNTQWDADSGHIFAAVHGSSDLVDIDPATALVVGRIALRGVTTCHVGVRRVHVGDHGHASDGTDAPASASPGVQGSALLPLRVPSALASRYATASRSATQVTPTARLL